MVEVQKLKGKLTRAIYQASDEDVSKLGIPKTFVLDKVIDAFTESRASIYVFNADKEFEKRAIVVPADLNIEEIKGKTAEEIDKAFHTHAMKNLNRNLSMTMTIGADPEVFIEDKEGKLIYAFDFLPNKDKALRSATSSDNGNMPVYNDGFAAEYNTPAGKTCLAWVIDSVHLCLKKIHQEAKKHNPGARISAKTWFDIELETLDALPPERVQLGCVPSFNAYALSGLMLEGREIPGRSTGGHIHFGVNYNGKERQDEEYIKMVKSLDMIVGVACVSLLENFDNPMRRQFYGLPGEFRKPPHGLEYRTLSNGYYCHPAMVNLVMDFARKVCAYGVKGMRQYWQSTEKETIDCILECNAKKAREIMTRNKTTLIGLLKASYSDDTLAGETGYKVFFNGLEYGVKDPYDVAGNWSLEGNWVTHCNNNGANWTANGDKSAHQIIANGKKV